jgi:hypothetical protein
MVSDNLIHEWVSGLPQGEEITVVSLLGRKHGPAGISEFSFYPFYGNWDELSERRGKSSFQEWLRKSYKKRVVQVIEHPTYDFCQLPIETLAAIALDIRRLLLEGQTVVLIDSGGETRTRAVCKHMEFAEDTTST